MARTVLNRRRFLQLTAASLLVTRLPRAWSSNGPILDSDPFTLGVASGDPTPTGVVLWTRLAPTPMDEHGGMSDEDVVVEWEVADDADFQRVVAQGAEVARFASAHSVHAEVEGLLPDRWYWYRFRVGTWLSPFGRTRTTPAPGAAVARLRLAVASCQQFEHGWYTAYRHMAGEDLDLVVHVGDYIYEGGRDADRAPSGMPRHHHGGECYTLADYRRRYAQYHLDPDLQAAHAAFPWVVTWDDHEVDNNYAGLTPEDTEPRGAFLRRRTAAYQAYYEHLPLRSGAAPVGPSATLSRRIGFGELALLHVLDTRQYRTDQPCGDGLRQSCRERMAPTATLTGADQERWLFEGLRTSPARWNVIAQQVFMAQLDLQPGPGQRFNMDAWDGYPAARDRLLRFLGATRPSNPVVLSGDMHSNWAADLKLDFNRPESATVGAEFIGTSITSTGDGVDLPPLFEKLLVDNEHIHFSNAQRGYLRCEVTPEVWRTDYRVLPYVSRPGAPVSTRASFVVENGRPGVQPA